MKQSILLSLLPALVAAGPGINPNPDPNFDPSTNQGTFGPFIPAQKAAVSATGGPTGDIDARTKQAMQLAISNWQTDTGIVSGFQNVGQSTTDNAAFMGIADGAFKAEVDELSQKAVLDQVIGNDPRVSIANLTLTNGVFQSVVDNLQIMSLQGQSKQNLIDSINSVRCVQILPSIDTYMLVAAEYIGDNVQQRRAVRPAACGDILAQAASNSSAFPNVPVSVYHATNDKTPANMHRVRQTVLRKARAMVSSMAFQMLARWALAILVTVVRPTIPRMATQMVIQMATRIMATTEMVRRAPAPLRQFYRP
jgi:hypothetical protein